MSVELLTAQLEEQKRVIDALSARLEKLEKLQEEVVKVWDVCRELDKKVEELEFRVNWASSDIVKKDELADFLGFSKRTLRDVFKKAKDKLLGYAISPRSPRVVFFKEDVKRFIKENLYAVKLGVRKGE